MDKIKVKRNDPIKSVLYMHVPDIATATACINAITRSYILPHNTMGSLLKSWPRTQKNS